MTCIMTKDIKLLKQTLRYFKEENAELIKREARHTEENAVFLDEITKLIEDVYYYKEALRRSENIVLNYLKDKERLEWLIDNASISNLRKDENGEEWWVELDYSEPRKDIDKQMEE